MTPFSDIRREAADALSRPVTEEMVERAAAESWRQCEASSDRPLPWDRCPPDEYPHWLADARAILTAALSPPARSPETAGLPQPDTAGGAVSLAECPVGLFVPVARPEALCLKTEYRSNGGRIDAYIVSSGEFFWGDHPQTIANQRRQMVIPFDIATREAAIRAEATAKERERAELLVLRQRDRIDFEKGGFEWTLLNDLAAAIRGGGE